MTVRKTIVVDTRRVRVFWTTKYVLRTIRDANSADDSRRTSDFRVSGTRQITNAIHTPETIAAFRERTKRTEFRPTDGKKTTNSRRRRNKVSFSCRRGTRWFVSVTTRIARTIIETKRQHHCPTPLASNVHGNVGDYFAGGLRTVWRYRWPSRTLALWRSSWTRNRCARIFYAESLSSGKRSAARRSACVWSKKKQKTLNNATDDHRESNCMIWKNSTHSTSRGYVTQVRARARSIVILSLTRPNPTKTVFLSI